MEVVPTKSTHVIIDLWGCDPEAIRDPAYVLETLKLAADATGATVVHQYVHDFNGDGASAVCVLSESHISCHTWPQSGFVSADSYTCGLCDPAKAVPVIEDRFRAKKAVIRIVDRGVPSHLQQAAS